MFFLSGELLVSLNEWNQQVELQYKLIYHQLRINQLLQISFQMKYTHFGGTIKKKQKAKS